MTADAAATDTGGLFELPAELAIDTDVARRVIGQFIRGQLRQAGFERAVLGLSGGIDSALVAYLDGRGDRRREAALRAHAVSDVVARLARRRRGRRPPAWRRQRGRRHQPDGRRASSPTTRTLTRALRRGNFMARQRMAVLYDRSVTWGGLVVGTGNKTESLIGYTTLFGDSACAFNPIGDLYKSQVRQIAAAMGVPEQIITKAPSADLWPGQTDEVEAGFSYPVLDRLLFWRIDKRRARSTRCSQLGFDRALVERVDRMVADVRVQAPGAADREARAADGRRRLPLSTAPAGFRSAGDRRAVGRRRTALRRRDADREPRRRHAAGPRGAARVPLIAAEDTRLTRRLLDRHGVETRTHQLPRPERARAGPPSSSSTSAGGEDLALVTDAGTPGVSDPGAELVAAWAAEGGAVVPIPGASAVLAAVVASGIAGPRWSFEGFLPRSGRERRERIARIAGGRARRRSSTRRPVASPPRFATSPRPADPSGRRRSAES